MWEEVVVAFSEALHRDLHPVKISTRDRTSTKAQYCTLVGATGLLRPPTSGTAQSAGYSPLDLRPNPRPRHN
jgi:hypothetical protein